jgi:transcriptional regulator with XRE-family HTH domain
MIRHKRLAVNYGIIDANHWQERQSCKYTMGAPGKDQDQVNFIASKVDHLFQTITRPDGKQFTYREVSEGSGLNLSYIRKLRVGMVANPSRTALEKLTYFFGVKPDYWFRTDDTIPIQVRQDVDSNTAASLDKERRNHLDKLLQKIEAANLDYDEIERLDCFLNGLIK